MQRISETEKETAKQIKGSQAKITKLEKDLETQNSTIVDLQLQRNNSLPTKEQLVDAQNNELRYMRDQINVLRG